MNNWVILSMRIVLLVLISCNC